MANLNLCLTCRRRLRTCVCEFIKPFETHSRFIILMHPMEYKKERMGTGRLTHLILRNSAILVGLNFHQDQSTASQFNDFLNDPLYESFLLYPGEGSLPLEKISSFHRASLKNDHSKNDGTSQGSSKRAQFFILDGTWPCAKKMMKENEILQNLPKVSFARPFLSEFKIKHQPFPGCLSTIESVHQVLLELKRINVEDEKLSSENLMDVFRHIVHQQLKLASDPDVPGYRRKPYRPPEQRPISQKWSKRSVFFKGH